MIYVASSWRNEQHGEVVQALRDDGLEVYDFKEPTTCFKWAEVAKVDEHGVELTPREYWAALTHPRAEAGFAQDMSALERATTVVLVLPAGPSAHLEAGWAVGAGKPVALFLPPIVRDMDLMHLMILNHYSHLGLLVEWCRRSEAQRPSETAHGGSITAPASKIWERNLRARQRGLRGGS